MKKVITVAIILIAVIAGGYYLFKISPAQDQVASTGYNGAIKQNTDIASISVPPAFDPKTDHYLGNPNAKNVFIEYADMQCPYCAAQSPVVKQVPDQFPDTVFVFRYFPLLQHQNTIEASLAVEAAGVQGKYWEMHDMLFAKQADWETESDPLNTFAQYAQQVGVKDINQFKNDITSKKYLAPLQKGEDESYALKLGGTPSYFMNGHFFQVQGAFSMDSLKQAAEPYLNK